MGVKIRTNPVEKPAEPKAQPQYDAGGRELAPGHPYKFKTRVRDRRPDPMGPAARELLAAKKPTKHQMMAAYRELLPPINLTPYYTQDWGPLHKRHSMLFSAVEAEDGKAAKGLTKQLWDAYKQIMKNGEWQDRWGAEEPRGEA